MRKIRQIPIELRQECCVGPSALKKKAMLSIGMLYAQANGRMLFIGIVSRLCTPSIWNGAQLLYKSSDEFKRITVEYFLIMYVPKFNLTL